MPGFAGAKIALAVCGGIAAYKVAGLARELTRAGAEVHVLMTASAREFVGAITFSTLTGNPVRSELFPPSAPTEIAHTDLGRTSDLVIVAPATAKTLAKAAQGVSDDLVSALLLSARCPVIMAPAMHTEMWMNEATQKNAGTLIARGVRLVGPAVGALAGPDVGIGRMADIEVIVRAAGEELQYRASLEGVRLMVSAGGTREAIDAMRYIGNASSGAMGYEIAFDAIRRGAEVTLITAPTQLIPPDRGDVVRVVSAEQMHTAVLRRIAKQDALVMAAAVADWRPADPAAGKLSKSAGPPVLDLEPTRDILAEVGRLRKEGGLPLLKALVGFCAETGDLAEAAQAKLLAKSLDLAVANRVGVEGSGPGMPDVEAVLYPAGGPPVQLGLLSKRDLAGKILNGVAECLHAAGLTQQA